MSSTSEADTAFRTRVRRQEVIAEFGRRALETGDRDGVRRDAAATVAETLDLEHALVLERIANHRSGTETALLTAGVGRCDELVGSATVSLESGWTATTLRSAEPVIVDPPPDEAETETDDHRSTWALLSGRAVESGLTVRLGPADDPWGVLGGLATEDRAFTDADAEFLRGIATVLESALDDSESTHRPLTESEDIEAAIDVDAVASRDEQRVHRALETASEGISLLDENGEFVYVNEAYADLYGYDPEAMLGMHWEALYPEGLADEFREDIAPALSASGTWSGETIGLRSDGTRFIEDHTLTETDDGGLVCVVRDVTKRRRLERELDEVYSRITDAFVGLDADWTLNYVNGRAAELLETAGDDLVGRPFWSAFPDATAAFEAEFHRAVIDQESVSFETYVRPLEAWFEVNVYPSETGLSVYFRDVTGRKETERELRETNRTLRRLYEITADGERPFERKVDRLLELGRDRLGLEIGFVARVDPDADRFEVVHAIGDDERIRPGATAPLSETYCQRTIRSDASLVLVDTPPREVVPENAYERWDFDAYAGGRIATADGLYGTICFAADEARSAPFTPAERSFLELATQWLGYELERRHRQAELETLVSDLETSNERLEQFAYAASHDLQEPLRMISSYLRLIEGRYAAALDEDGREFIEFAVDGSERMREMIDGLLEYSRVETRGEPLQPVDLDDIVADVFDDLSLRIAETDADVTVEVDSLPTVEGDASQLRQVFQNLLGNALTYSGDEPPRVSVDARRRGPEWLLSVSDEGIGIDPDDQDRVFEVFDRLHSREEYEGAGIGLALCQRIVERHGVRASEASSSSTGSQSESVGGDIWIDSEPGEGATFSFTLPAA